MDCLYFVQKRFDFKNKHRANQNFKNSHNIPSEPKRTYKQNSLEINEIELNYNCHSDMSSISAKNEKHLHFSQHHCNTSASIQQDVSHEEISEHDKAYFTEDIASPGKGF